MVGAVRAVVGWVATPTMKGLAAAVKEDSITRLIVTQPILTHESQGDCTLVQTKDAATLVGDEGLLLVRGDEQGGDTVSTKSWDIHVANRATTGVTNTCSVVREHVESVRGLTSRLLVLDLAESLLSPVKNMCNMSSSPTTYLTQLV